MSQSKVHIDQLGRKVSLDRVPERIISVVPSQTELLADLGLEEQVVGITKFCIHPTEWFRNKERVGGTKNLDMEKIRALQPDLILANKEENNQDQILELAKEFPVWISDVDTVDGALDMIRSVGAVTGAEARAEMLVTEINGSFNEKQHAHSTAIYLIWNEPMMVAGSDTFISDTMGKAGFRNLISETRYPELTDERVIALRPEFILLSSEPFPFKEEHRSAFQERFPDSKVLLVDGEMFSWYGSRMVKAKAYFDELMELHNSRPE